jgi:hypothetical protein
MCALPLKADIAESDWHDPLLPKAEILRCAMEQRVFTAGGTVVGGD